MLKSLYWAVLLSLDAKHRHAAFNASTFIKIHPLFGANTMSKEQKSNKEDKKKPALSPKEKKAVKKSKKDAK